MGFQRNKQHIEWSLQRKPVCPEWSFKRWRLMPRSLIWASCDPNSLLRRASGVGQQRASQYSKIEAWCVLPGCQFSNKQVVEAFRKKFCGPVLEGMARVVFSDLSQNDTQGRYMCEGFTRQQTDFQFQLNRLYILVFYNKYQYYTYGYNRLFHIS